MRLGIPTQLVGGPRPADPREDGISSLERPVGLLTEPLYRARLREATRTDWRFLLGVSPHDVVLTGGPGAHRLASALAPWVSEARRIGHEPPATASWVVFSGDVPTAGKGSADPADTLENAFAVLRPGGHVAFTIENRWGLHWLADWRTGADDGGQADTDATSTRRPERRGLRWHVHRLRDLGAERVDCYALLPSRDAPRAIIPVDPPCPPAAQKMALDQVWQRATPTAALVRRMLGLLVDTGLMRGLYPHYLLVGRKPC